MRDFGLAKGIQNGSDGSLMTKIELKLPSDKKFGWFFTSVFLTAGVWAFFFASAFFASVAMTLAFGFFLATNIKPSMLRPLNLLWMKLGQFLGKIFNPLVLGVLYFGMFTPVSLLFKLQKRDELRLANIKRHTYWVQAVEHEGHQRSLREQY